MTEQGYSSEQHNQAHSDHHSEEIALEKYEQIQLHGEDLEEYNELGLPHEHPHVLAKATLEQLARLPLMDMESDQEPYSEHTVALSA